MARWASYALTGLELPDLSPMLPALGHPEASVRCAVAYAFQARKESALPYVWMLTPLLDDPDESVRERAVWMFKEIGPGAAEALREVRRRKGSARLRRTALEALAATSGPAELDELDLAALRRLIRIRAHDEVPGPMHLCGSWFALPTSDRAAVLEAFGLSQAEPVTMRMGESAWVNDHHDWGGPGKEHRKCSRVYVSPVLDGWTLVFGRPSDDAHRIEHALRAEREEVMHSVVRERCAELSDRFGVAHWYGMSCGDGWTSWCIAENGTVQRFYDVYACEEEQGPQHPGEQGYLLPHQDGFPDDAFDGVNPSDTQAFHSRYEQVKQELGIPDSCYAVDIAGHLSVDPSRLGPAVRVSGQGLLALTACGLEHGHPRGALQV